MLKPELTASPTKDIFRSADRINVSLGTRGAKYATVGFCRLFLCRDFIQTPGSHEWRVWRDDLPEFPQRPQVLLLLDELILSLRAVTVLEDSASRIRRLVWWSHA